MDGNRHQDAVPAGIAVVTMPAEVTYENARDVQVDVVSALARANSVLVVDLTHTLYCDSSGIRELVHAHRSATAIGAECRVVAPSSPIAARAWSLRGLDQLFQAYPTLAAALNPPWPAADWEVLAE